MSCIVAAYHAVALHLFILYRYTLCLVFSGLLRHDVDDFVADWNNHKIRKNKLSSSP